MTEFMIKTYEALSTAHSVGKKGVKQASSQACSRASLQAKRQAGKLTAQYTTKTEAAGGSANKTNNKL